MKIKKVYLALVVMISLLLLSETVGLASTYLANTKSGKFHYYNCPTIKNHGAPYFVTYNSRELAIANGYIPCKRCAP